MKKIFAFVLVVLFACVANAQNNSYYSIGDSIKFVKKITKYKEHYERAKKEEFPTNMKYFGNKYNKAIEKYYCTFGYNGVYENIDLKTDIKAIFNTPITNEPPKQITTPKNPINLSGEYLMIANRLKVASLATTLIGGGFTAIAATTIKAEDESSRKALTTSCYVVGIGSGVTSLFCYISSLVYERKGARILENIKFNGNTITYNF